MLKPFLLWFNVWVHCLHFIDRAIFLLACLFLLMFPFCICFSLALSGEYDCLPLRFSGVDRLVWCEMPEEPWKGQRPTATHRRRNVNENIRWALFSADSRDSCGRIWILWWLARRIQSRLRPIGSNDKRAQLVCSRVVRSSSVFVWQLAILIFLFVCSASFLCDFYSSPVFLPVQTRWIRYRFVASFQCSEQCIYQTGWFKWPSAEINHFSGGDRTRMIVATTFLLLSF